MKVNQLKYIEGSLAKLRNDRDDYLFFMLVKQHHDSGYIKPYKGLFTDLGKKISMSKQSVSRRLKNSKFITPIHKKGEIIGYALISNNSLWEKLGYEPKETTENNPKGNGFKNEIKIAKLTAVSKQDLLKKIKQFEVTRLTQRVAYKSIEDKDINIKDQIIASRIGVGVSISNEAISKKLGYSSRMEGNRIAKMMAKEGIIYSKRQKCSFIMRCKFSSFKFQKDHDKRICNDKSKKWFFYKSKNGEYGKVLERNCNLVTLLKDEFSFRPAPYNTVKTCKVNDQCFCKASNTNQTFSSL